LNDPTIKSVSEAVQLGLKYKFNWWRGQNNPYKALTPKIFRDEYYNERQRQFDPNKELGIIYHFQRIAPTIVNIKPDNDNTLEWLILMQHHGVPTRLLDWSESILVGLFFAAQNEKADGELWRLFAQKLNIKADLGDNFPLQDHPILKYLSNEPLYGKKEKLAKDVGLLKIPNIPVAFYPTLVFNRMNSQLSTFTIHPPPVGNQDLEDALPEKKFLQRYIIPSQHKQQILLDLASLGINNRNLFHDLDSLAMDIKIEFRNPMRNLWGQPDPERETQ